MYIKRLVLDFLLKFKLYFGNSNSMEKAKRCNMHEDCAVADEALGVNKRASHCYADDCDECFGN